MTKSEILDRLGSIETAISQLTTAAQRPFYLEAAAEYLNISKSHLYQLTCRGLIGHYKPAGKRIYFEKSDLDEYLKRNRVRPQWEIEDIAANHGDADKSKTTTGQGRRFPTRTNLTSNQ